MDAGQQSSKNVSKIALGAMGVLLILGTIYYKERTVFSDAAFSIFHLINSGRIDVPGGNRYGAFVVQVLPFFAQKLHLPVKAILFFLWRQLLFILFSCHSNCIQMQAIFDVCTHGPVLFFICERVLHMGERNV